MLAKDVDPMMLAAMPGPGVPWQCEEACHEAANTCLYGDRASCSRCTQGLPLVSLPSGGSGFDQSACAQWSHRRFLQWNPFVTGDNFVRGGACRLLHQKSAPPPDCRVDFEPFHTQALSPVEVGIGGMWLLELEPLGLAIEASSNQVLPGWSSTHWNKFQYPYLPAKGSRIC